MTAHAIYRAATENEGNDGFAELGILLLAVLLGRSMKRPDCRTLEGKGGPQNSYSISRERKFEWARNPGSADGSEVLAEC
jgi:hypothetical protein